MKTIKKSLSSLAIETTTLYLIRTFFTLNKLREDAQNNCNCYNGSTAKGRIPPPLGLSGKLQTTIFFILSSFSQLFYCIFFFRLKHLTIYLEYLIPSSYAKPITTFNVIKIMTFLYGMNLGLY